MNRQEMGWLRSADLQHWYKGQVPYLEKVWQTNLSKQTYFSKLYRKFARDNNLPMRYTCYINKTTLKPLRFSKYGRPEVEKQYAMHIVCKSKLSNSERIQK